MGNPGQDDERLERRLERRLEDELRLPEAIVPSERDAAIRAMLRERAGGLRRRAARRRAAIGGLAAAAATLLVTIGVVVHFGGGDAGRRDGPTSAAQRASNAPRETPRETPREPVSRETVAPEVVRGGSVDLEPVPTQAVPAETADLTGDGVIDVLDAFALARAIESGATPDPAWDLTRDGVIDESDVDAIARAAVSLRRTS